MKLLTQTTSWTTIINVLLIVSTTTAASLEEWRSRTIYQVLTDRFARSDGSTTTCNVVDGHYCGGSWKGITAQLDYITGMHFDAIWISPIVSQITNTTIDGEAYTAFWANDLYALNPRFGTEDDLKELICAVHSRGMLLMLDIVVNHMAYAGSGKHVDYDTFNPFNDKEYFHDYCKVDGNTNATEIEACWLGSDTVALADLKTDDETVRSMFGEWISELVSNYSIDGLRIDTALNVEPEFFPDFVDAAGVFATGETMSGDNSFACRWGETIGSILNYPIYYPLIRAFSSSKGSINDLVAAMYAMYDDCDDPTAFGSFTENHDIQRFAEITNDPALAKNVIAFTILADGIPIIYQGQEQHMSGGISPYTNRAPLWSAGYDTDSELYRQIADLVLARRHLTLAGEDYTAYPTEVIYQDYHSMAMRKGGGGGQVITVLNNNGESAGNFTLNVTGHELEASTLVTEVLSCTNLTVSGDGVLVVPMVGGLPRVMYPAERLQNSGLCGMGQPLPRPTSTATTTATSTSTAASTASQSEDASGAIQHARADSALISCLAVVVLMLSSSAACEMWH